MMQARDGQLHMHSIWFFQRSRPCELIESMHLMLVPR